MFILGLIWLGCGGGRAESAGVEPIRIVLEHLGNPPLAGNNYRIEVGLHSLRRVQLDPDGAEGEAHQTALTAHDFRAVVREWQRAGVRQSAERPDTGCAGGNTIKLKVWRAGKIIIDGYIYFCGPPPHFGTLDGDVATFARFLDEFAGSRSATSLPPRGPR